MPLRLALLFLTTAGLTGCGAGPALHPAAGRVQFKGGQPVTSGVVEFVPANDGPAARGKIEPDGRFTLSTGDRSGAVAGPHRVAVVQVFAENLPAGHKHKIAVVPKKYARPETSGLTREVEPGKANDFVLDIDPGP